MTPKQVNDAFLLVPNITENGGFCTENNKNKEVGRPLFPDQITACLDQYGRNDKVNSSAYFIISGIETNRLSKTFIKNDIEYTFKIWFKQQTKASLVSGTRIASDYIAAINTFARVESSVFKQDEKSCFLKVKAVAFMAGHCSFSVTPQTNCV